MEIRNNPYCVCQTSARNPYVDRISFKPVKTEVERKCQISFMFNRLAVFTNTVPYILTVLGTNKPSPFYSFIMNEVDTNTKKYNCTKQELKNAYGLSFEVINAIANHYNQTGKVDEKVFEYGITVLNEKYAEDIKNQKLNHKLFVDGMKIMREDLIKYKTTANILNP